MKIFVLMLTFLFFRLNMGQAQAFVGKEVLTDKTLEFPSKTAKVTVIVFLSAKCPCSGSHEADLAKLSQKYKKQGFEFIAIHANQDESQVFTKAHFQKNPLPFPVVQDEGAKIANELKALKTPHVFVMSQGKILFEGGVDDSADASRAKTHYLSDALQAIADGKPVVVSKARALGCFIKR